MFRTIRMALNAGALLTIIATATLLPGCSKSISATSPPPLRKYQILSAPGQLREQEPASFP
jgi:hypothetical protein